MEYSITGTASGQVSPSAQDGLLTLEVAAANGSMAAVFELALPAGFDASQPLAMIFASGAVYHNGYLRYHEQYGWGETSYHL